MEVVFRMEILRRTFVQVKRVGFEWPGQGDVGDREEMKAWLEY